MANIVSSSEKEEKIKARTRKTTWCIFCKIKFQINSRVTRNKQYEDEGEEERQRIAKFLPSASSVAFLKKGKLPIMKIAVLENDNEKKKGPAVRDVR